MVANPKTITEALKAWPEYPEDHPETLQQLIEADPDSLTHPLAWWLRKEAVSVRNSTEQHFITTPQEVLNLIEKGYVFHVWDKKWRSYELSDRRQPVLAPNENGSLSYVCKPTHIIPKTTDLENPAKGFSWLVLYGGSPEILLKDGVTEGLTHLIKSRPVSDICFYSREENETIFCSAKANTVNVNGVDTPHEDMEYYEKLKSLHSAFSR